MSRPVQQHLFERAARAATSSANERVNVKLWAVDDTSSAKAVKFLTRPEYPAREVWVPRSLMGDRISKKKDPGCVFWRWEFTLPRWKVAELEIEYDT